MVITRGIRTPIRHQVAPKASVRPIARPQVMTTRAAKQASPVRVRPGMGKVSARTPRVAAKASTGQKIGGLLQSPLADVITTGITAVNPVLGTVLTGAKSIAGRALSKGGARTQVIGEMHHRRRKRAILTRRDVAGALRVQKVIHKFGFRPKLHIRTRRKIGFK